MVFSFVVSEEGENNTEEGENNIMKLTVIVSVLFQNAKTLLPESVGSIVVCRKYTEPLRAFFSNCASYHFFQDISKFSYWYEPIQIWILLPISIVKMNF
jgi:hypothetical protein